jgi:hypothetical protein
MTFYTRTIAKTACIALTLSLTTVTVVGFSAEPAFAERGGNGNGNGRGNRADRGNNGNQGAERGSSGNNGRGQLARELGSLNAAHANPNALANASPNSMPGKLNVYKQAQETFAEVLADQDEAYAAYQKLILLTEEEVAANYPDGGYEEAVTNAAIDYAAARDAAAEAEAAADESLSALTGGQELSEAALAELWRLLDL